MNLLFISYTLVSFFSVALCNDYNPATECVNGIRTAIAEFHFAGTDPEDYWVNLCTNNLSVTSLWATTKLYCHGNELDAGITMIQDYCTEYGTVTLTPYADFLPNLTNDFIASLERLDYEDIAGKTEINHPFVLSEKLYETGRRTTSAFERQYKLHTNLGWAVYGFWGFVLLAGMFNRFVTFIFQRRIVPNSGDPESTTAAINPSHTATLQSLQHWLRTYLVTPATIGTHHQRPFYGCAIPTRVESLVVLSFWALNIIICCVSYEIFWPNLYYTVALQNWRYISDRTGIIAYANLPLIWMFSGRNNVFIWLTGWSFATFNVFHRHVARIATIQAIVHSIGYTAIEINAKSLAEEWKEEYWYMGAIATIVMSLLLVSSSIYIRQKSYEVFLLLHIAFSIMMLVGLFYHTAIFTDREYDPYLWPPVAIWCFDRAARLCRLAYCNLHVRFSQAPITTSATVSYNPDADLIRVEIHPGSANLKPAPGQHYFIYQPLRWKGWENHPFTLARWTTQDTSHSTPTEVVATSVHTPSQTEKDISITPHDTDSTNSSTAAPPSQNHIPTLTFLIRPFTSWTSRLRTQNTPTPLPTTLLLEGPYGSPLPLHTFETVIFIVGGTGIASALPYLQAHVEAVTQPTRAHAPATRTRDVTLVWAAKQAAMLRDVGGRELARLVGVPDVHLHFHATRDGAVAGDGKEGTAPGIVITFARPNIRRLVLETVARVTDEGGARGRVAVVACGPAGMADEAREAAWLALKGGSRGVEYFEEAFGW